MLHLVEREDRYQYERDLGREAPQDLTEMGWSDGLKSGQLRKAIPLVF